MFTEAYVKCTYIYDAIHFKGTVTYAYYIDTMAKH